jgi:hypothetical protein
MVIRAGTREERRGDSMIHWWWLVTAFWFGIISGVALYAAILYKMCSAHSAGDFIPNE